MTKFKKLTAILLSAVMLVCCFAVQAGAASVFDTAATEDLELDHVIPVLPASVVSCIVSPTFIGIVMQLILEDESVSEEGYVAVTLSLPFLPNDIILM